MKIISFIYERKVLMNILEYLGIFQKQEHKRGPPSAKRCLKKVIEPYDDGWPEYEEPAIDVQTL